MKSWFQKYLRKHTTPKTARKGHRLWAEPLEDRVTPAAALLFDDNDGTFANDNLDMNGLYDPSNGDGTNDSDDAPVVSVSETGSKVYRIRLATDPGTVVAVALGTSNASITVTPTFLSFKGGTTGNWDDWQEVTVNGVDDDIDNETEVYASSIVYFVSSGTSSTGNNYNGLVVPETTVNVTDVDHDKAGVIITDNGNPVTEAGGAAHTHTYTIVLTTKPTATVTVNLTADSQITLDRSSVVFTAGSTSNWNVPQIVTVTAVDDFVDEAATHDGKITHAVVSTDGKYSGKVPRNSTDTADVATLVTNVSDDDDSGVTYSSSNLGPITEGGSTNFTIRLKTQPTAPVTITFGPTAGQLSVSSTSITFSTSKGVAGGWDMPQTITVTALDNFVQEGALNATRNATITVKAVSTDANYNKSFATVDAVIRDNDAAGVTISPATPILVAEGGSGNTFSVVLNSKPLDTVKITVNGDSQVNVNKPTLTFTTADWNQPQVVTVTAEDDDLAESTLIIDTGTGAFANGQTFTIGGGTLVHTVISHMETSGNTTAITFSPGLRIKANDNDLLNQVGGNPVPSGFRVNLPAGFNPSAGVIKFSASSPNVDTTNPGDPNYNGLDNTTTPAIANVTADVADNDVAGIVLTSSSGSETNIPLSVVENGATDFYYIRLKSKPASDVVINFTSPSALITLTPNTFTFDESNWDDPKKITVTAVQDNVASGNTVAKIDSTIVVASSDSQYKPLPPVQVSVSITDDDSAGLNGSPTTLNLAEGGFGTTYDVSLKSQPTSMVTVKIKGGSQLGLGSFLVNDTAANATDTTIGIDTGAVAGIKNGDFFLFQGVSGDTLLHQITSGGGTSTLTISPALAVSIPDNTPLTVIPQTQVFQLSGAHTGVTTINLATGTSVVSPGDTFSVYNNGTGALQAGGPYTVATTVTNTGTNGATNQITTTAALTGSNNHYVVFNPGVWTMVFLPGNYSTVQKVSVTAVDDVIPEGNGHAGVLQLSSMSGSGSPDAKYSNITYASANASIDDNETIGLVVNQTALSVTEGVVPTGTSQTFTVALNLQPKDDVEVRFSFNDSSLTATPSVLTFKASGTANLWNVPQTVTLTANNNSTIDGSRTRTVRVYATSPNDANFNGKTQDIALTLNDPANQAPTITFDTGISWDIKESTTLEFKDTAGRAIKIDDPEDDGIYAVKVSLSVTSGTFTLSDASKLSFTTGDGISDSSVIFTGKIADINAALEGMVFTPTPNYTGPVTLSITVDDQGNAGSGGTLTATRSRLFSISSDSDLDGPTINTPVLPSGFEVKTGGVLKDAVTLNLMNGTGLIMVGDTFLIEGDTTTYYVKSQKATNGNTTQVTCDPKISAAAAAGKDVTFTRAVNEDGSLVFSTVGKNAITITDPHIGTNTLTVTLTAQDGVLTLPSIASLTSVSGNGTDTLVFTGTLTRVNAALNGLKYAPNQDYHGSEVIGIKAESNYLAANGDPISPHSTSIDLQVNSINDRPTFAMEVPTGPVFVGEGEQTLEVLTSFAGANETGQVVTYAFTSTPAVGSTALNALFSKLEIDAGTGKLTYTPKAAGTATIVVTASDDGDTVNGGFNKSVTKTFTITNNDTKKFTDTDGDTYAVTFKTGAGSIVVNQNAVGGKGPIDSIELTGTNQSTSLTVSVTKAVGGDGIVTIGSITGPAAGTINIGSSDLIGDGINLAGRLGALTVRNVQAGSNIIAGGNGGGATDGGTTTNNVEKTTISAKDIGVASSGGLTGSNIKLTTNLTLKANSFGQGKLEATALAALTIAGDFNATEVKLSGFTVNANKPVPSTYTLGTASIGGKMPDSIWTITGKTGKIAVAGQIDDWTLAITDTAKNGGGDYDDGQLSNLSLTGDLIGASIDVAQKIGPIAVKNWKGLAGASTTANTIKAAAIASLTSAGDFLANLNLADPNLALGTTSIGGKVSTTDTANPISWTLTNGFAANLTVKGAVDNLVITASSANKGKVGSVSFGAVTNTSIFVDMTVGAVTAASWDNTGIGLLNNEAIMTVNTSGTAGTGGAITSLNVAGNFNANLTLTGDLNVLPSVIIGGNVQGASGANNQVAWTITKGFGGNIDIKGTVDFLDITATDTTGNVSGKLTNLTLGTVSSTDVEVATAISLVKATSWSTGTIKAATLGNLNITGTADFGADVTLTGNGTVLSSATINGKVKDADFVIAGSVGTFQAAAFDGSRLLLGIALQAGAGNPVDPTDGTMIAANNITDNLKIGVLIIKGAYSNSLVAAHTMSQVTLTSVTVDNANKKFGFLCEGAISKLTVSSLTPSTYTSTANGTLTPGNDDFSVTNI